ncbi:Uncharacterised protein [Chlamydia trachomatis]|nr:Uncharacterised protein [Chlamydia trachomatis]
MSRRTNAVDTGAEKLVKNIVLVRGHNKRSQWQAHLSRHVGCANIAEVARGNDDVNSAIQVEATVRASCHLQPGRDVIHDLGEQARPIDRVDRAQVPFRLKVEVHVDRLDQVLAVIEYALNCDVHDVVVQQGEHLRALECCHASGRSEHDDRQAIPAS